MINDNVLSDHTRSILAKFGKAINKGIGEDVRAYLQDSENATNNAVMFLRGDFINTNIRDAVITDTMEYHCFSRGSWKGFLVIDHTDRRTYSVCAKKTLERIPNNKTRRNPHYLQSILNVENRDEKGYISQMSLDDFGISTGAQFTDDEFQDDYWAIMEDNCSELKEYRHWLLVYEAERNRLVDLSAVMLDAEFNVVNTVSVMDLIEPDFATLTSVEVEEDVKEDAHMLVSIKQNLAEQHRNDQSERTKISVKVEDEGFTMNNV